ncbi:MAG TPA: DUF177 domain-containing protein [Rhizomicrobium sp.]|jgi:uncharacterized metal-binding protein YceD (DUF177 family)
MDAPFSSIYDLSRLSDAGAEVTLAPNAEQRAQLAEFADVQAIEQFEARVILHRHSASRFALDATLKADVVQKCVVTLEPVRSHVDLAISRALHLTKFAASARISEHELAPGTDEGPEEIQDTHYDIAAPVLEEFVLAIDPYPRAPGVIYEPPTEEEPAKSPFAALKSLKGPA